MTKDLKEVAMAELPYCDYCGVPARYDGATDSGSWAYMCERHFMERGLGLGTGVGQKLIVREMVG